MGTHTSNNRLGYNNSIKIRFIADR